MEEEILKELKEIKELLQIIVSNQEQNIEVTMDGDGEKVAKAVSQGLRKEHERTGEGNHAFRMFVPEECGHNPKISEPNRVISKDDFLNPDEKRSHKHSI